MPNSPSQREGAGGGGFLTRRKGKGMHHRDTERCNWFETITSLALNPMSLSVPLCLCGK